MPINLIDTHCHINFFKNAGDIAINCEKQKVHTIYVTTLPSQFNETFEYVKYLKYVHPSLGFHCLESKFNLEKEKNLFLKNLNKTKYIGEVGLDFSKKAILSNEEQIEIFEFVLESIFMKNKIVNVHSTNAEYKVLELLVKYRIKKAIFHWYSGNISTLNEILKLGYYLSINESMCKSKKGKIIISKLPKNSVLIETDSPFIKEIVPYNNFYVYKYLSDIWNLDVERVSEIVISNFNSLYNNREINLFS